MTGRERVTKTIRLEKTDRVPWVPFVGSHAASLLDMSPTEYLQSEDAIVRGVTKAVEMYYPDGIPVLFDLQIEAEAMGCDLRWSDDNPPAVVSHAMQGRPLSDFEMPTMNDGRIPMMMNATRTLREKLPDTALFGLITGPFTLALHQLGIDIFMQMFDDPEGIKKFIMKMHDVGIMLAKGFMDAGCDVVAVVDPMTSQISPEHFQEFVTPALKGIYTYIRDSGGLSSLFVCGDAQKNITVMADSKPDNICIDENIPLDFVKSECLSRGISFGGNMRLTTVMLMGTPVDNQAHAIDCMNVGGETGYILAPGCDIPYATPPENISAISKVVTDPYEKQIAIELAEKQESSSVPEFDLSEYGRANKVIVDIITLDSEGCAPCQYMVESVRNAIQDFEGLVEWREHKIKHTKGVAFMASLMVRNIPTICIDGKIKFVSIMPKREELIKAIQDRINEKLRYKISRKRAQILVFGDDGETSQDALKNVKTAIHEMGTDVEAVLVTDPKVHNEYGIRRLPTVVTAKYSVKTVESVPDVAIIKEWIKMLEG